MKQKTKRWLKVSATVLGVVMVFIAVVLFACNSIVVHNAEGKLYSNLDDIPPYEVGLLLGTSPQSRYGRGPNAFFYYRIEAAAALYKAGKIRTILVSGDACSLDSVDEVVSMRDSLVVRGVPTECIVLDGKGYRTYDSVVRACEKYGHHSFLIISQKFHNERAMYLAEHLDMPVENIAGFNAKDATSSMAFLTYIREYFARVKVFVDMLFEDKSEVLD